MQDARTLMRPGAWLLAVAVGVAGCAAPSSREGSGGDGGNVEAIAEKGAEAWRNKDYEQAMKLLQQAALQGNARAQYAVGYMYYEGQGVEQDADKAVPWFRRAANQGDERAIKALRMLSQGISRQQTPSPNEDGDPGQGSKSKRGGGESNADEASDNTKPASDAGNTSGGADEGPATTRTPDDG